LLDPQVPVLFVNALQSDRLQPAFIFTSILKIILFSGKIGSSWEIRLLEKGQISDSRHVFQVGVQL